MPNKKALITPDNLKLIGFVEINDKGSIRYRKAKHIIWFNENGTYEASPADFMTFGEIIAEITKKLPK
jgi:hypothetical protein